MPAPFAGLADLAFLILTSTLLDSFLFPIKALRVKTALPSDFLISMRVVPQSATAMEYLSLPESYARYNESGHASHAHLISMYSPSAADFLSVESVSLFFIGKNSCLQYISSIVLPRFTDGDDVAVMADYDTFPCKSCHSGVYLFLNATLNTM